MLPVVGENLPENFSANFYKTSGMLTLREKIGQKFSGKFSVDAGLKSTHGSAVTDHTRRNTEDQKMTHDEAKRKAAIARHALIEAGAA
ncbi:MAG: hypothetical protein ABEI52_05785, partial [Halobacteriaceae archaeon]